MKVALITARFPWPPYTGERVRTVAWLDALGSGHEVTLLTPAGRLPAPYGDVSLVPAPLSLAGAAGGASKVLTRGLPASSLLAARYAWPQALARALASAGRFDLAIVILTRLHPWVAARLGATPVLLDAIDSLAESARERGRATVPPWSWVWRWEARRLERLEHSVAARVASVLVVADGERAGFGGSAETIPLGIEPEPLVEGAPRDFDLGFWGRLGFFANADAASWLLGAVWPRVRNQLPDARLLIAGADAPRRLRAANGRDGVTVFSPMGDRAALARRVKVAVLPLRFGTGISTKALEAAEAGCALVATAAGVRGVAPLAAEAVLAGDAESLAAATCRLLRDEAERVRRGRALRDAVSNHFGRADALRRMCETAEAVARTGVSARR
jgi:glycosyltransferase involved in cell wall biosynthesis